MSTNAPTSRARPTRSWIESKGTPSVLTLPGIIMAHRFSLVKEMYRDMGCPSDTGFLAKVFDNRNSPQVVARRAGD
jgi:hypothetical protein